MSHIARRHTSRSRACSSGPTSDARRYLVVSPVKYSVITFGCRVNQADSLVIERDLRAQGAVSVPVEQADVVIVNTCSVTASADQGARQTIRRIVRSNPRVRMIVTGCYATRRPDEVA